LFPLTPTLSLGGEREIRVEGFTRNGREDLFINEVIGFEVGIILKHKNGKGGFYRCRCQHI
jgi:hypothetical protein